MEGNKFSKVVGGILIGGMLLSGGGMALADDATTPTTPTNTDPTKLFVEGKGFGGHGHRGGGFGQKGLGNFQANLDQLVTDGVITQAKADEIKTFLEKQAKERQAEFDKIRAMTPEERKAEMEKKRESNKDKPRIGLFEELVSNNILTQAEADKIKDVQQAQQKQERAAKLTAAIDTVVKAGTITEAQGEKIVAALDAAEAERDALRVKLEAMTKEERQQYCEENKDTKHTNPLEALITAGTITEDQAKALYAAMGPQKGEMGGKMDGHRGGPRGDNGFRGGSKTSNNQTSSTQATK